MLQIINGSSLRKNIPVRNHVVIPRRKSSLHDVIECLTSAMEARDSYTSGHSNRVADMTLDIAGFIGIKGRQLENIHLAAHLHDIGKFGITEQILNKKEKLLPEEWQHIKKHPEIGFNILHKPQGLKTIVEIVLHHHERWDGKGYPDGLKQDMIPLGSRIIAIADSMDAMTSQRPYRGAKTWEQCMDEVMENKGIQFDPALVRAAEKLWTRWKNQNSDNG
jgi:HD-GYP domain-containing protein (c-di-GMP phosphodiesterase class II)